MGDVEKKFAAELEEGYEVVDKKFDAERIYGEAGSRLLLKLAAKASHHSMPYGLTLQAALLGCTNGARIQAFPNAASPLSMIFLNVNLVQTRKSQLSSILEEIAMEVDSACRQRARAATHGQGVQVQSIQLKRFTEAAFFQRCAADWQQCQVNLQDDKDDDDAAGQCPARVHYSTLLNVDEAYRFLKMLGLSPAGGKSGSSETAANACETASEFNRVLQSGVSSYVCKNSGSSHGGESSRVVNVAGVGNVHPSAFFPVLRGEVGSHHVAGLERFLLGTGRPVEPHADLPAGLELPASFKPWRWCPLMMCMLNPLGLSPEALQYEYALQTFPRCDVEIEDQCDEDCFLPDAAWFLGVSP